MSVPPVGSTATYPQGASYTGGLNPASVPLSLREHFGEVADTAWTYTRIRHGRPGLRAGCRRGLPDPARRRRSLHLLLPVPPRRAGGDARARHPGARHRRAPAPGPGRRDHLAGHPPGGHAGADGPAGGRAAGGRAAPGAGQGQGGGRPGPAGHVLQPDGQQPAAADPPARGAEPRAAAVRLRRLPRAAHPADHGADGRRRAARRPPVLRPGDGARGRAAPERSSTGSRRCWSTCWRSAASTPARPSSTSTRSTSSTSRTGSSTRPRCWPASD